MIKRQKNNWKIRIFICILIFFTGIGACGIKTIFLNGDEEKQYEKPFITDETIETEIPDPEIKTDIETPEQKPETKPTQTPEQKPETKPEQKPESKPTQTPEQKPEFKPEQKPETKPTQIPEQKPESKPEQKPESKPTQTPEQKPESKPQTHTHSWSQAWKNNGSHHWHICIGAGTCTVTDNSQKNGYGAHVDKNNDGKCDTCEYTITHTHSWSSSWVSNGSHHWHNCTGSGTCTITSNSKKNGYGAHADKNNDGKCDTCGYNIPHVHNWSSSWTSDGSHHWHNCTGSGTCTITSNSKKNGYGAHADKNNDGKCDTCGYTMPHNHNWSSSWASDGSHHWHNCTGAGTCTITSNSKKNGYGAHADNNGDGKCDTCGYVMPHNHSWSSAWTSDENNHWHECIGNGTCDITVNSGKSGFSAHVGSDGDGKCDICGAPLASDRGQVLPSESEKDDVQSGGNQTPTPTPPSNPDDTDKPISGGSTPSRPTETPSREPQLPSGSEVDKPPIASKESSIEVSAVTEVPNTQRTNRTPSLPIGSEDDKPTSGS